MYVVHEKRMSIDFQSAYVLYTRPPVGDKLCTGVLPVPFDAFPTGCGIKNALNYIKFAFSAAFAQLLHCVNNKYACKIFRIALVSLAASAFVN